ncbi:MAG: D-alanyl-D-alanine carboxypeptidase family protein [Pseudomonadota bacterium]
MVFASVGLSAHAFETVARAAYAVDHATDTVLISKDAERPLPPASMSKLMTLYMTFEAIREGRLRLDERLPVSEHAMSFGGSTMFLDTTDRVRVEDLIRGIIVLSGNDACVVIAEALSPDGSEAGFARAMTQRAQALGMTQSTFVNASGWPAAGHLMSMRDLGILAARLINDFPEFYPMFAEREFLFDGRAPSNTQNRNPLLLLGIGADGLKTGHTREAGFGLVGSAKQGDRRVTFVLAGLESARQRAVESERLINWAFRQFAVERLASPGVEIARAEVWMGDSRSVGLISELGVDVLMPALADGEMAAEIVYHGPLEAPVTAGTPVADLVVRTPGLPETRHVLVAAQTVERGGFLPRMRAATQALLRMLGATVAEAA